MLLGDGSQELVSRLEEVLPSGKTKQKMLGLTSASRLKQPEFVEDGERNAWLTSLALIYKWHGFSLIEAERKISLRLRQIPGHAMSRNCRQVRLIVNAVYRNQPGMAGIAVGLPLPQWVEDDFGFQTEILDQTGTSTSRRGVAPVPIRGKPNVALSSDWARHEIGK